MGVRDRFVRDVLESEGATLLRRQGSAISSSVKQQSGRLMSSREITVSGGADMDGKLTLEHPIYERFLDMKRLGKARGRRKGRKIHNRFVFGAYASIARTLMWGLTEDVARRIRENLGK